MKRNKTFNFFLRGLSFCIFFLLLAFSTGDSKSEYILPLKANSVCSADLDLDGDMDIVVGHNYNTGTEWSGISISLNQGNGYFYLFDSIYLYGGQSHNKIKNLNANILPEIIGKSVALNPVSEQIAVIYDFDKNNISYFDLFTDEGVGLIETGDINGDSNIDIVVASNGGKFWGVLYNDGTGNFSEPEYYDTEWWPLDISVSDIDGNGMDDIAIAGQNTEIYYSFETGFEYYLLSGTEHSIELEDMDNDGDLDVITIWGAFVTTYIVYENLGYQNFLQHIIYSFESVSGGLRTPDLNNDSLPEITLMLGDKYYFLYNQGDLIFSEPDFILPDFPGPQTYTCADVDSNSFCDILIVRDMGVYEPNLKILFNDGNGNFLEDPITSIQTSNPEPQTSNLTCYPNPFTIETTISFTIAEKEKLRLQVFDLKGTLIISLSDKELLPGQYKIMWNGTDKNGKEVTNGTYLISLHAGRQNHSIRTVLNR